MKTIGLVTVWACITGLALFLVARGHEMDAVAIMIILLCSTRISSDDE